MPGATKDVKWGADEVYSVGGRMFAVFRIEGGSAATVSFKCVPARFLELTDVSGIVPAPYLARAHWVQVREATALPRAQLESLLVDSHVRIVARLPRRLQPAVAAAAVPHSRSPRPRAGHAKRTP